METFHPELIGDIDDRIGRLWTNADIQDRFLAIDLTELRGVARGNCIPPPGFVAQSAPQDQTPLELRSSGAFRCTVIDDATLGRNAAAPQYIKMKK